MSNSQDSATTIVCREVFDEASHPSNEEVLEYAKRLGIDPDAEPHLLDLAREGLMAALPKGWSPCFHEPCGSFYYHEASTGNTTWEHPLDARYKELVEQARAGHSRQHSVDDDSKTTAKDLESHEDATLPKEPPPPPSKVPILQTKIPSKLAPLKKTESRRNKEQKKFDTRTTIVDRKSRDYTNLRFQDPKFYESPKLLATTTTNTTHDDEMNLREIVKRSESMSPRYEKDWEQLSNKFSSEENVIDIDKLSVSSLTKSDTKISDKFDKEKHPRQLGQQRELTLSGGGSMFLKSNRSRDNTPSQDGGRLEDFQAATSVNEMSGSLERPKSILREKLPEDDDRPLEEERKSVRFDLDRDLEDMKFLYSGSEDEDWDSVSEIKSGQENCEVIVSLSEKIDVTNEQPEPMIQESKSDLTIDNTRTNVTSVKRIGNRFLVQNVTESEHTTQLPRDDSNDTDYIPTNKFGNIKNIDLLSKSDTESTPRTSGHDDTRSSNLDEIRKSKELMLAAMIVTDQRIENDKQREKDQIYHMMKLKSDLETVNQEQRSRKSRRHLDDDVKLILQKQHDREIVALKRELEAKLERTRMEMEANFNEQQIAMKTNLEMRLNELQRQLVKQEEEEVQKLISEMDELRRQNLEKVRNELEVCYEKERQEIHEKLKVELDDRKRELLELRNREIEVLESEYERTLDEDKALKLAEHTISQGHSEKIEEMKKELEKEYDELRNKLRSQQREKVTKITEDHEKCLAEILRDFRVEEGVARKVYKQRLEEVRADFSKDIEKEAKKISERATRQETVDFEKIRCEKRLLEDKYKTLKEKYLKLKNDVRLAVERRSKRKESNTTASETEKSASTRTRTDRTEASIQKISSKNASTKLVEGLNQNSAENSEAQKSSSALQRLNHVDARIATTKFESDDTTTASETMNSNIMMKKKKIFGKKSTNTPKSTHNNNNSAENPVENIRKQLEKLEELGDQLPTNESAYTLRYPFQDKDVSVPVNASSELEFFRHRIHVERDSVQRARETLKAQRNIFQGIQKAWKQRSARATLEQLVQEERELSEMEVSLHRTKSLLGEKVIHLKHLEQSLERVATAKKNENEGTTTKNDELTLSDMSSASSGFSSTDLGTDTIDKPDYYQESTEIIASLENLNSEIREIWGVLNKRRGNTVPPPPTLVYSDLRWMPYQHMTTQSSNVQTFGTPNIQSNILSQLTAVHPPTTTTTQNIIAQYGPSSGFTTSVGTVERGSSNLIERTRNMRDWLRQARVETTDLISPGQATL